MMAFWPLSGLRFGRGRYRRKGRRFAAARLGAALIALLLLQAGCRSPDMAMRSADLAGALVGGPWSSAYERDHPLTGRIWESQLDRFVPPAAMLAAAAQARYVVIGEKHDNADHHRLQAMIIRDMIARGRRPAVAFEMLGEDATPALDAYLTRSPRSAEGLGAAVGWERRGWPDWDMYRPIAQAALDAGLPLVAADASREITRSVGRGGLQAIDATIAARLGLGRPIDAAMRGAILAEMERSHCGRVPPDRAQRMVDVQRLRDAHMAERMIAAAQRPGVDGAVLITGFGHGRVDRGVPFHLRLQSPRGRIVSIALIEVSPDETEIMPYVLRLGAMPVPFDYIWFTPRVDALDPCEKFAPQLERFRAPG